MQEMKRFIYRNNSEYRKKEFLRVRKVLIDAQRIEKRTYTSNCY